MPKQITIPDGKDLKNFWKANWGKIIPWVLVIVAAVVIYRMIFHGKRLPEKVEDTEAYKAKERENDSLKLVIVRARDSVNLQSAYVDKIQTALTIQRSAYRMTEKQLHAILNKPDNMLPDLSDSEISGWLSRKYGRESDSAQEAPR